MPKPTATPSPSQALVPTDASASLALIQDIIATIPQADEDPTERMAAFILTQPAERWDELWAGLPSIRDYAGKRLAIHAIRARESDFEGPLGIYFILDATDLQTGAHELVSCSSQMSMIQLLALHRDKRFPVTVEVVQKEKKTARGFHPIHLRYLSPTEAPLGDPGAVVSEQ
jgi:hypothetical protein